MRLTLRTLLAYLDDTLDSEEAKLIGQKVAESAAAQELVERINKVTRRRSLANPAAFGDESKLDPNTVAEYLNDVLSADDIAEVEQTCLEHDVYLAEVAACHQILTLMLSETVRVPPTARQRMYRLVKGRESIPYRRPPAYNPAIELGGKFQQAEVREPKPARWPQYLAGALALSAGLGLAVWLAWPERLAPVPRGNNDPVVAIATPPSSKPDKLKDELPKDSSKKDPVKVDPKKDPVKVDLKQDPVKADPPKPNIGVVAVTAPSKDKREIGRLVSPAAVLLQKGGDARAKWTRVANDSRVSTDVDLLAMPGSRVDLKLDTGLILSLWAGVPELLDAPVLETAATLYAPPEGIDLDLMLDRGRVVLSNPRVKPGVARVRFGGEIWDVGIGEQGEVLMELLRKYPGTVPFSKQPGGEGPLVTLLLGALKGRVDVLRKDLPALTAVAPALIDWNSNKGEVHGPFKLRELLPGWVAPPANRPQAAEARVAQDEFARRMAVKDADVVVALAELEQDQKPAMQALGVFGLGAVNAVAGLVDALDEPGRPAVRGAAILALRQWCARKAENDLALHALLRKKKNYSETNADLVLELLHDYSPAAVTDWRTYQSLFNLMGNDKLPIRTLAFRHMLQFDPLGEKTAQYDPDADDAARDKSIAVWRKRIPNGKLPPKPAGTP